MIAFSGLFDLVEVNFYQPFVQEIKEKKIDEIESAQNEYFDTLIRRFDSFAVNPSVRTYVEPHPQDTSVRSREILRSALVSSTKSLIGIRIISNNGRNVFFSTFSSDIISDEKNVSYRNYDNLGELDFDSVKSNFALKITAEPEKKIRIFKDGRNSRIVFSLPFYDSDEKSDYTILFYCEASGFSQFLFSRNLIDINGYASLVTSDSGFGGFIFGLPNYGRLSLQNQIIEKWKNDDSNNLWLVQSEENENLKDSDNSKTPDKKFCVFSRKNSNNDFGFIAFLYDESELKFPPFIRLLLLATAFVTFYLAFFLILSFRHDDIVVIRDKISRYQNEFFIAWKKMGEPKSSDYLIEQKNIVENRALKSLGKKGIKHAAEFKAIFESSWNEMFVTFCKSPATSYSPAITPQINADELKEIVRTSIQDILKTENIHYSSKENTSKQTDEIPEVKNTNGKTEDTVKSVEKIAVPEEKNKDNIEAAEITKNTNELEKFHENVEKREELPEEAEELTEEPEEIEELQEETEKTESPEEVEELSEEAEEIEELKEEAEAPEEVEELKEEAEEIEELQEETEEAESPEEAEELKEEPEEIEELSEVDETEEHSLEIEKTLAALPDKAPAWYDNDDVELDSDGLSRQLSDSELHDIEKLKDSAASIEKLDENLENLETIDEVKELDVIEDVGEDENVGELDAVEEPVVVEDVEDIEDAEEVEDVEEIEDVEELDEVEDAEAVEDAEELDEVEDAEAVEDVEELDEVEDAEAVEDVEELDEVEDAEEIDDVEELEDIEESADSDEIEDADNLDENKKLEKAEELEYDVDMKIDDNILRLLKKEEDDDDVYRDEILLEKIEFGVPVSETQNENLENSVAEKFIASAPDFSFLDDEDEISNKVEVIEDTESTVPAENANTENVSAENANTENVSAENASVENASAENASAENEPLEEIAEHAEFEPLDEIKEPEGDLTEEMNKTEENADSLENEERLPFSFTRFGENSELLELENAK